MSRFVVLLRGVNVGRAKRIAMADFRALLEGLGCADVKTLLNSGNAVFEAPSAQSSAASLATRIRQALVDQLGLDVLVIVKSAVDIRHVIDSNALLTIGHDHSRLMVALTNDAASMKALDAMAELAWGEEALHVTPHAGYLWCANGILESKLAVALLKHAQVTTRNWATVLKIAASMNP